MRINKRIVLTAALVLAVICLAGCNEQVTAQMIPGKEFREWFYQRLTVTLISVAVLGVIFSVLLRRFRVKAPEAHTNYPARIAFAGALASILLLIPLALWLEAYWTQPFGRPISLSNYFPLIIENSYTLLIVILSAAVFYLVVMLGTRVVYGRDCNCKYAFLPNFKRAENNKFKRV
jgi:hypothetical protein